MTDTFEGRSISSLSKKKKKASCLRKDHLPGPCLRFLSVRNVPGCWILTFTLSLSLVFVVCLLEILLCFSWRCVERLCVSAVGSVKQNSMWQNGEICQVLSTEAFTSFCQVYDGTMGSKLPKCHCLCLRTLRKSALFFLHVLLFAHAVV